MTATCAVAGRWAIAITRSAISMLAASSEAVFGMLWSRPGLDMKTRALICVVSDTAQARWPELAIHLRMARNQGWTEDELSEALMHLCGYIGLPSVREALLTAKEVFEEMR